MSFEELVCEVSDQPRKAGEIAQWVVASLEKPVAVADGHGPGKMGPSGQRWARQMEGSITWKGFQGGIVLFFINAKTLNSHPHNKTTVQGPKTQIGLVSWAYRSVPGHTCLASRLRVNSGLKGSGSPHRVCPQCPALRKLPPPGSDLLDEGLALENRDWPARVREIGLMGPLPCPRPPSACPGEWSTFSPKTR